MERNITSENQDKDPVLAFLLGYCIPGLGHYYIGKKGKALFFMTILIFTFLLGFYLCHFSQIAPFERNLETDHSDFRYSFIAQVGIGVLAWGPALYQKEIHPPEDSPRLVEPRVALGLLYMMVAGLLNILVAQNAYEELAYPNRKSQDKPEGETAKAEGEKKELEKKEDKAKENESDPA